MKPEELRIGNYVKTAIPNSEIMIPKLESRIQAISLFGELSFMYEPTNNRGIKILAKHVTGIKLTKEWLLKLGFKKSFMGYTKDISTFKGLEYKHLIIDLDQGIMIRQGSISKPRHEDDLVTIWNVDRQEKITVHQLQNLYYALTEQELKII